LDQQYTHFDYRCRKRPKSSTSSSSYPRLGIGDRPPTSGIEPKEPLVWTINEAPQKHTTFNENKLENAPQGQNGGRVEQTLNKYLGTSMACKIVEPDEIEFASATPEAHRKGEKAYHVKAFKGSKDGKQ
jgi:hypothetical protein